ncbi:CHAT domain-containing protein [Mycena vulgaris]|nr:CHAT domain-containing protein [Mycena vulgaris]
MVQLLLDHGVDVTAGSTFDRTQRLQNLAISLRGRYQRWGDLKDIEAAVRTNQEAVDMTPEGHLDRAQRHQDLAVSLRDRYRRLGDLKDLEAAIQIDQEVVDLTPEGHTDRAQRLQSLATSLRDQYRRLGTLKDLEGAVQMDQEAVDLTSEGHPDRAQRLQNLAVSLKDRYCRLGDLKDLLAAVQTNKEAVDLTPEGHPDRAQRLQNLAVSLTDQYHRLGNLKDLEAAVLTNAEAVDLTPKDHTDQAGRLQSLATSLRDQYQRLGNLKDLEAAIQTNQEAVDLTPEGHPDRALRLQHLAVSLRDRYQRLGDLKDLEAAIQTDQEAVDMTPEEHTDRAGRLQNLTMSLADRYQRLRNLKDLQAIHNRYHESFKLLSSAPEASWKAALEWASFAEASQSSVCLPAYQAAFALLPEILWIGHSIPVRHDAVRRLDIVDATSRAVQTCIKLSNLHAAVEFLEQGLATIFQQMLQLKTDVDCLPLGQAKDFLDLSSQLYDGNLSHPIKIVEDRKELLQDIRNQPGFEYFLLPKTYDDLSHASQGGPVVILTSHQDLCNAIVIPYPTSEPVHVLLPTVTLELLKSQGDMLKELLNRCNAISRGKYSSSRLLQEQFSSSHACFEDMLKWLATHVVAPVFQHGITNGRLWWLPTGGFVGLPLHASTPTDEFIHSYTVTLGSLLDAYTKKSSSTAPKLGIVGATHTDSSGRNALKGVQEEVHKIISIVQEPYIQCLVGEQATVDAVKHQLQDCSWFHLACHGHQDLSEPTKSCLRLYEGNLELETILRMPLSNPQFVFLAACETAMGDAELVNESFHLGGGFIAAGFRSVIGTMWSMYDADGPTVAEIVYSHLFRDGQQPQASDAAKALQLAVKELRHRKVPYERWLPFIHIGI